MRKEIIFALAVIFILGMVFAQQPADRGKDKQAPPPTLKNCIFKSFFISVSVALSLVTLLYFVGYFLNFQQLILISKSEISEIILTILILAFFVGLGEDLSKFLSSRINFFDDPALKADTIQQKADKILNATLNNVSSISDRATEYFKVAMAESSKSYYQNILSVGVGYSLCSTYSIIRGPASLFLNTLATGSMALVVSQLVLSFSNSYAICYLIPLGLFLRMLKFTKKAGSLLLALIISFYLVFPTSIVLFSELFYKYSSTSSNAFETANKVYDFFKTNRITCDPDPDKGNAIRKGAIDTIAGLGKQINWIIKLVVVQILFILFLSLSISLAFANNLSSILGLEIDLNALSRLS